MADVRTDANTNSDIPAGPELPIAEAQAANPGMWLLLGVTRLDSRNEPSHAELLYSSSRQAAVLRRLERIAASETCHYSSVLFLHADWPITTPEAGTV